MSHETTTETSTAAERVAAAERTVAQARERAEYHNWNGGSSRQYDEAIAALRVARRMQRTDGRAQAGRGALACALLATLTIGATLAALLLTLAAHGGF